MAPRTAVIGAAGFIGSSLLAAYRTEHPDAAGTDHRGRDGLIRLDLAEPDIEPLLDHEACVIAGARPGIADCERHPSATRAINATGTLAAVRALREAGVRPLVFSSDYVFDGRTGGYPDDAPLRPQTEYGRQKAELERGAGEGVLVLRLSKIFGLEREDGTLLDEMARILTGGERVRAARDQVFSPLWIGDLVTAVLALQAADAEGVFNLCSPVAWSRLQIARALAEELGADPDQVEEISLDDLGEGIERPKDTSMVPKRATETIAFQPLPLEHALARVAEAWR
jgi:dTDP-4-dehydrorhamnose reductase